MGIIKPPTEIDPWHWVCPDHPYEQQSYEQSRYCAFPLSDRVRCELVMMKVSANGNIRGW